MNKNIYKFILNFDNKFYVIFLFLLSFVVEQHKKNYNFQILKIVLVTSSKNMDNQKTM